jgi:prepilin-type N-terminal cleavage/methylation domain-containing protein
MKSKQKAFTLIELMVTLAMIGFLASIILLSLSQSRMKGRDAKRQEDTKNMIKAMELYFSENNTYPKYGAPDTAYDLVTALNGSTPPVAPNYLSTISADPLTGAPTVQPYLYIWGFNGREYAIDVFFEATGAYCKYRTSGGNNVWFGAPDCPK